MAHATFSRDSRLPDESLNVTLGNTDYSDKPILAESHIVDDATAKDSLRGETTQEMKDSKDESFLKGGF